LIAFGIFTVMDSKNASMASSQVQAVGNPYLAGVITSAANPYFWIWWLSIGSALVIDGLRGGLILAGIFMIGHWCADFGWYTLVSTSLGKGRTILSEANYHRILAICGSFLILFGLYFLISVQRSG
jgi:threonine/homoserine/homoserine lactone efflux protein